MELGITTSFVGRNRPEPQAGPPATVRRDADSRTLFHQKIDMCFATLFVGLMGRLLPKTDAFP